MKYKVLANIGIEIQVYEEPYQRRVDGQFDMLPGAFVYGKEFGCHTVVTAPSVYEMAECAGYGDEHRSNYFKHNVNFLRMQIYGFFTNYH